MSQLGAMQVEQVLSSCSPDKETPYDLPLESSSSSSSSSTLLHVETKQNIIQHNNNNILKRRYSKSTLSILSWNCNSISAHNRTTDIQRVAESGQYDIIAISETGPRIPRLNQYERIKIDPKSRHDSRGLAVYIHISLQFSISNNCVNLENLCESLAIEVKNSNNKPMIIWFMYLNPKLHNTIMEDILHAESDTPILIIGDLNARCRTVGNLITNGRGRKLDLLLYHRDCRYIALNPPEPTFSRPTAEGYSSSIIDLALIDSRIINWVKLCRPVYILDSDHNAICVTLNFRTSRLLPDEKSSKVLDTVELKRYFSRTPISTHLSHTDAFIQHVATGLKISTKSTKQKKKLFSAWWNDEINQAMKNRNAALRLPLNVPDRSQKIRECRYILNDAIYRAKAKVQAEIAENCNDLFRIIKARTKPRERLSINIAKSKEKANEIDKQFEKVARDWFRDLNRTQVQILVDNAMWRTRFRQAILCHHHDIELCSGNQLQQMHKRKSKKNSPGPRQSV